MPLTFSIDEECFYITKIIIDRFHVVKHCNKAFQDFRIKEMKRLKQQNNRDRLSKIKSQPASLNERQNVYQSFRI